MSELSVPRSRRQPHPSPLALSSAVGSAGLATARISRTVVAVATGERDSEGFPVCNEDTIGSLYTDEFEVV
jgi:hypothetical protein